MEPGAPELASGEATTYMSWTALNHGHTSRNLPMPCITEMIQDSHAHEHGACLMEYTLCDSKHRIFEYSVATHAIFSSCTLLSHCKVPIGSYGK
jgi:hypothetical protein